jgi:hypothetical protein
MAAEGRLAEELSPENLEVQQICQQWEQDCMRRSQARYDTDYEKFRDAS